MASWRRSTAMSRPPSARPRATEPNEISKPSSTSSPVTCSLIHPFEIATSPLISPREQQLLAFLGVLLAAPQFVFADRAWATLTSNERRQLLSMLSKASIGYICNCETDGCRDLYDTVLDCKEGGGWTWTAGRSAV